MNQIKANVDKCVMQFVLQLEEQIKREQVDEMNVDFQIYKM